MLSLTSIQTLCRREHLLVFCSNHCALATLVLQCSPVSLLLLSRQLSPKPCQLRSLMTGAHCCRLRFVIVVGHSSPLVVWLNFIVAMRRQILGHRCNFRRGFHSPPVSNFKTHLHIPFIFRLNQCDLNLYCFVIWLWMGEFLFCLILRLYVCLACDEGNVLS